MKKIIILLVLVVLVSGCASIPKGKIETSRVYNANYDTIWQATVNAVLELDGSIGVVDKDSGLLSVRMHQVSNLFKYVNFTLGITTISSISLKVSKVNENSSAVDVHVNVYGSYSNGTLEKEYLDKIETVLNEKNK
jgi:hypothetical protein